MTAGSVATELSSRLVRRKGGGGGKGGSSSGGKSSGSTAKAGPSSGSVKPARGGVYGGSTGGRVYPGTPYHGTYRQGGTINTLPITAPAVELASRLDDDPRNLCPLLVGIGRQFDKGKCTINGNPAMDVYADIIRSRLAMGTAEDAEQYGRASTDFAHGLRSVRETECEGDKLFEQGGEVRGVDTVGEALSGWADYYEEPKNLPGIDADLKNWCNKVDPYDKGTGITEDQSLIATDNADTFCKAMLIAQAAPDKTFNGESSQVFFEAMQDSMEATLYTNNSMALLGTQIGKLDNSKLDGLQSEWMTKMREQYAGLENADPAIRAQARETFGWASRCDLDKTGKAAGKMSLLPSWAGTLAATAAGGLLAIS